MKHKLATVLEDPTSASDSEINNEMVAGFADMDTSSASEHEAVPVTASVCYYASNSNLDGCQQVGKHDFYMSGKNASPKNRLVCDACATWLLSEKLAKRTPV